MLIALFILFVIMFLSVFTACLFYMTLNEKLVFVFSVLTIIIFFIGITTTSIYWILV